MAPLGGLTHLEAIQLPGLRAELLVALRRLPRLRAVTLANQNLGVEIVSELVQLPGLQELELNSCDVTPALLRSLAKVGLRRLKLLACRGFDADAQRAVATLYSLEAVSLQRLMFVQPSPDIDPDAFRAICGLPRLRDVTLLSLRDDPGDLVALLPQ